jgi:hypothetical protein
MTGNTALLMCALESCSMGKMLCKALTRELEGNLEVKYEVFLHFLLFCESRNPRRRCFGNGSKLGLSTFFHIGFHRLNFYDDDEFLELCRSEVYLASGLPGFRCQSRQSFELTSSIAFLKYGSCLTFGLNLKKLSRLLFGIGLETGLKKVLLSFGNLLLA